MKNRIIALIILVVLLVIGVSDFALAEIEVHLNDTCFIVCSQDQTDSVGGKTDVLNYPRTNNNAPILVRGRDTNSPTASPDRNTYDYVLNRNPSRMRYHLPSCPHVKRIKDTNIGYFAGNASELATMGYIPCGVCLK